MKSAAPSSPVLYLSEIDEAEFEGLKKVSNEIEDAEYQLNSRLEEVSSPLMGNLDIHLMILGAVWIGKSLEFTKVSYLFFVCLLFLTGLHLGLKCFTNYKLLLYLESKARMIQLEKKDFCIKAEEFVARCEGLEGDVEAATKSGLKLEYGRTRMSSMKKSHSNEVKSYYWVFWMSLTVTWIYFTLWFVGCTMVVDFGGHWFDYGIRSSTAAN